MTSEKKRSWMFYLLLPFAGVFLLWAIAPVLVNTENVTVFFWDCSDLDCAVQGDLSANLFTRDYELTKDDGSVVMFRPEAVRMMSWPVPED